MLAGDDPWLAVGSPVDVHDEHHAPARLPAQGHGSGGIQPQVQPQADPYAQLAAPVPQGDQSTAVDDQMQGGFSDQHPDTPHAQLSPEDQANLTNLYHTGTASDILRFLVAKGYHSDPSQLALYVEKRDAAKKNGGRVNYGVSYQFPDVSEMKPGDLPTDLQPGTAQAAGRGVADDIPGIKHITAFTRALDSKLGLDHPTNRSFGDEFNYQQDLGHGVEQGDQADHPWARISGQLLGGLAVPTGLEGMGLKVGTDVLRAGGTMAEARAAVKVAIRNRMAAVSGTYGALHGAGEAETPSAAVTGALAEGALGAATGGVMGQVAPKGKAAIDRAAPALTDAQQVVQAAERQGITPFAPDVGGSAVRRAASATVQTPLGASPLVAAAKRTVGDANAARDRIATAVGQALQPEAAGQTARTGAQKYIAASGAQARGIYQSAEKASDGVQLSAPKALETLDQNIAELKDTPGGAPGLSTLQEIRNQITSKMKPVDTGVLDASGEPIMRDPGGRITVQGLRGMRTVLRDQFIKDGLRGSDIERRVKQVTDAAAQDVTDGLNAAGKPEAAAMFSRADAMWRDRADTIDNVIKPLIGTRENPKSGEQVIKTLTADLQGNNARAVRFLRALPPEEQANTRASIIGALGRQSAGAQNADGDGFSLAQFLTHWNRIGETAKRAYFGDESRSALNDLARVAQGSKEASAFANKSNSGGAVNGVISGLLAGPTAGLSLFTPLALGHMLASPRFARWLARAPRTALSTPAYVDRLSRIARAEPAIANEVLQLQQRLASAFTGSSMPTRLAAQEPTNEPDGGQGNASDQQPENQSLQP